MLVSRPFTWLSLLLNKASLCAQTVVSALLTYCFPKVIFKLKSEEPCPSQCEQIELINGEGLKFPYSVELRHHQRFLELHPNQRSSQFFAFRLLFDKQILLDTLFSLKRKGNSTIFLRKLMICFFSSFSLIRVILLLGN